MAKFEPGELRDEPLVEAARYLDARTEEMGLVEMISSLGLDFEKLMYVVEQRALRGVLVLEGEEANFTTPTGIELNPRQRAMLFLLQPSVLDGIVIGWFGKQLALKEKEA